MNLFGPPDIRKMEARGDIQGLIKALYYRKNGVMEVHRAAVEALVKIGSSAVEPLIIALNDGDVSFSRASAAEALIKIGSSSVEPLITALKNSNVNARQSVVEALVKIGDARAVEPLIAALKDQDKYARQSAAEALGKIGDTRAVEPLIAILNDGVWEVGRSAVEALVKIGDARAVEPLIATLKGNVYARLIAAEGLGKIGDARAVEPLIAALKDGDKEVVSKAAEALGKIGDSRAVKPLGIAKQDKNTQVREEAGKALSIIGGEQAKELLGNKSAVSIGLIESPVFQWSGNGFMGSDQARVSKLQRENDSAIAWFNAQNFVHIPTFAGEKGAAEYCFDMALQAQNSGNVQEAWAGYHQALNRFCSLTDEKMIGLTCFNLGKVYGVRENWEMAQLMFLQSAYLTNKIEDKKGCAWSIFYLGDTCAQLGNKSLARKYISQVLPIFRQVSPEDVPGVEKALRRLSEK